jgi:hypothetical protein
MKCDCICSNPTILNSPVIPNQTTFADREVGQISDAMRGQNPCRHFHPALATNRTAQVEVRERSAFSQDNFR